MRKKTLMKVNGEEFDGGKVIYRLMNGGNDEKKRKLSRCY
jgi:hypothetical protein